MKSLRNGAIDGFWVPVTDLSGTLRLCPWTKCEKRWRAGHWGIYPLVAGKAKWKFPFTQSSERLQQHREGGTRVAGTLSQGDERRPLDS